MEEAWKDVSGYEGYYQVSNLGRVKSLSRKSAHWQGGFIVLPERILKANICKGYCHIILCKDAKTTSKKVHRLAAEAFIPNPENKPEVNHKNGIKTDNRIENLEWCTRSENGKHALKTGLRLSGDKIKNAKFKNSDIPIIKELLKNGEKRSDIAKLFNVTPQAIGNIDKGRSWKYLDINAA